MGDARPRTLAVTAGLGAASSSCSYAAVALARSLFRKGADFTAAMAFEIASTNLVIELGVILALLLGWQFTLAEFVGGPLMIVFVALLFRFFLRERLVRSVRGTSNAPAGLRGRHRTGSTLRHSSSSEANRRGRTEGGRNGAQDDERQRLDGAQRGVTGVRRRGQVQDPPGQLEARPEEGDVAPSGSPCSAPRVPACP